MARYDAYRLWVSSPALTDLREIQEYYLRAASENVSNRLIQRIYARFQLIKDHPYIGVARPEYGEGVRAYHPPGLPYIIAYTISGDIVRITRVVDGRRNLGRLFG